MPAPIQILKWRLKALAERAFNITIYRRLPRGIDPFYDLKQRIPEWEPTVIFDVGANVGQSATVYAKRFPSCRIFSFEPCEQTFRTLEQNVSALPNVQCFRLALGSKAKRGVLVRGAQSSMNRIVPESAASGSTIETNCESVETQTIDGFCIARGIENIDYLKIDTEGGDLEVLRGVEAMLRKGQIDVVEVEVGIGLDNELHVPLQQMREHLESRSYAVFGFYEQMHEWKRQLAHLRRINVVFISKALENHGGT